MLLLSLTSDIKEVIGNNIGSKFKIIGIDQINCSDDLIGYIRNSVYTYYLCILNCSIVADAIERISFLSEKCKNIQIIYIYNSSDEFIQLYKKFPSVHYIDCDDVTKEINSAICKSINKRNKTLETEVLNQINSLSLDINSLYDLDHILKKTCTFAVNIFGVDHCGLVLRDEHKPYAEIVSDYPNLNIVGTKVPIEGIDVEENLFRNKTEINIYDIESYNELGGVKQIFKHLGVKSTLIVPVVLNDTVIGSFSLDMMTKKRRFLKQEISLCNKLANNIAVAFNTRKRIDKYKKQIGIIDDPINESMSMLHESFDNRILLKKIVDYLKESTHAKDAHLIFYNNKQNLRIYEANDEKFKTKLIDNCKILKGKNISFGSKHGSSILIESEYLNSIAPHKIVPLQFLNRLIGYLILLFDNEKLLKQDYFKFHQFSRVTDLLCDAAIYGNIITLQDSMINNSPFAIICVNPDGFVRFINQKAINLLEYEKADEFENIHIQDIYWGGLKEAKEIKYKIKNNTIYKGHETYILTKNRKKIPIFLTASILKNRFNEDVGSMGLFEDQRIQSFRGRTKRIFDLLVEINKPGIRNDEIYLRILMGMISIFNAACGGIYEIEERNFKLVEELNTKEPLKQLGMNDELYILNQVEHQGNTFKVTNFNHSNYKPMLDSSSISALGLQIPVKAAKQCFICLESLEANNFITHIDVYGPLMQQFATVLDRSYLETNRLTTTKKLFATSHAVAAAQLGTGLIHEIKNPLNSIALTLSHFADVIRKLDSSKEMNDILEEINLVNNQILKTYNLTLKLQKFKKGIIAEKKNYYLNDIVNSALEITRTAFGKKKIKVIFKPDPALDNPKSDHSNKTGNSLLVDEFQIEQVLINLIMNAIRASYDRTAIQIKTELKKDEKISIVSIQDNGTGIYDKNKKKIFEPFFTTYKEDGVGLGLFISKYLIVENHGGSIEFDTDTNKGSTFVVKIPLGK
ncbi:MAG: GAF domain-containing protein [Firmicutes bacterium]|nr:GAF domain-containing protein [Bacillota bacterium]